MNVEIDTHLCKAYANCTFEAPDIFEVDEVTGKAKVLLDMISEDRRGDVERAIEACPVQAIQVVG